MASPSLRSCPCTVSHHIALPPAPALLRHRAEGGCLAILIPPPSAHRSPSCAREHAAALGLQGQVHSPRALTPARLRTSLGTDRGTDIC